MSEQPLRHYVWIIASLLAGFAGFVMWVFITYAASSLEGRLFPVVSRAELISSRSYPPPVFRTIWVARAFKYRNCQYLRTEWFLGPRDGARVLVPAEHVDAPEVRGPGLLQWEGLVIWLEPEAVLQNSHADVIHRCHFLWETRTPFYG